MKVIFSTEFKSRLDTRSPVNLIEEREDALPPEWPRRRSFQDLCCWNRSPHKDAPTIPRITREEEWLIQQTKAIEEFINRRANTFSSLYPKEDLSLTQNGDDMYRFAISPEQCDPYTVNRLKAIFNTKNYEGTLAAEVCSEDNRVIIRISKTQTMSF